MKHRLTLIVSAPLKPPQILSPCVRHACHRNQNRRVIKIDSRLFSASTRSFTFKKYTIPQNFKAGSRIDHPAKMAGAPEAPRKRTAYIALGSNLGDRIGWIEKACNEMDARGIKVKRTSSLWETEPMYVLDQDRFVNGACEVETTMEPLELLDALQDIERALGRKKLIDKGPRNIDLDILLYDNLKVDHERLKIPHIGIPEREFVLRPLAELIPDKPIDPDRPWRVTADYLNALPPSKTPLTTMTPLSSHHPPIQALNPSRKTHVMAILNMTPDSFSDGGQNLPLRPDNSSSSVNTTTTATTATATATTDDTTTTTTNGTTTTDTATATTDDTTTITTNGTTTTDPSTALHQTITALLDAGASMIDIGGQSTAPGTPEVPLSEELARVIPAIQLIRTRFPAASSRPVLISVDTYRAAVAAAAVAAGADVVNDVSGGSMDPDMLPTVARLGATVCLMHMRGTPATMAGLAEYPAAEGGLIGGIARELVQRVRAAEEAGIRRWRIVLDPGLGFAKVGRQNVDVLRHLDTLREWPGLQGLPWLVGSSRKSFIGRVTGVPTPKERIWGTAATVAAAVQGGADVVRVHDVREMAQVVAMADAIWRY
ncbi:Dihydropteroate synthase-like protein [Chaetomium fimeti]|uniref:Dihydropteroate synthase-like protein n=1 Tax=Chaetomium fimeti TaxID=1854472 RepID=A0AAE0LRB9_9PEZI|nr:Dihydropteroate synthase-like protein [Chaetomium fimeti]